ncbi:MAG: response regulator [Chitinophagales bacterium]
MSTILVIEDNGEMRENMVEILELASYEVVNAGNGALGIELAMLLRPNLIISDIAMPEMDGWQVLRAIRQNTNTQSIPFILISAKPDPYLSIKAYENGATAFLSKPFDAKDLLQLTAECLGKAETTPKDQS